MGCARRKRKQLPTAAFGGSKKQRGADVTNYVSCVNAKKSESKRTSTQDQFCRVAPHYRR
jgi:hypothetical protein